MPATSHTRHFPFLHHPVRSTLHTIPGAGTVVAAVVRVWGHGYNADGLPDGRSWHIGEIGRAHPARIQFSDPGALFMRQTCPKYVFNDALMPARGLEPECSDGEHVWRETAVPRRTQGSGALP